MLVHIRLCKGYSFDIPIISIGNISFGGTGKTPMVIHLCQKLQSEGYRPAVISRGYKRASTGLVVVNDGNSTVSNVIDSGDEPYLISNLCGMVPLMIGALKILFFAVFFALSIEDATSFALPNPIPT